MNFNNSIGLLIGVFTTTIGAARIVQALSTPGGDIAVDVAAFVLGLLVTVLNIDTALSKPVEGETIE